MDCGLRYGISRGLRHDIVYASELGRLPNRGCEKAVAVGLVADAQNYFSEWETRVVLAIYYPSTHCITLDTPAFRAAEINHVQ